MDHSMSRVFELLVTTLLIVPFIKKKPCHPIIIKIKNNSISIPDQLNLPFK